MSKPSQAEINQIRAADTRIMQVIEKLEARGLGGMASTLKNVSDELTEWLTDAEGES